MVDINLEEFAKNIPKAENHIHIEGTLTPELIFELAKKNKISLPYDSVETLKKLYKFKNLEEFLNLYYQGVNVVITEDDFKAMALDYCDKACPQGLRYAEIFFDPQSHLKRGIKFETIINGLKKGLDEGKKKYKFDYKLILCFLRDYTDNPGEEAIKTLKEALPFKNDFFAVGLDSGEVGHPPSNFIDVYKLAAKEGLKLVAHAGEEGDPSYIRDSLDLLNVKRIDHGIQIIHDEKLMERVSKEKIPLTVCPLSNKCLQVYPDLTKYPIKTLLNKNIIFSINSDDPSYFGGYIGDNYYALVKYCGINAKDMKIISKNSFKSTFLEEDKKEKYIKEVDEFCSHFNI